MNKISRLEHKLTSSKGRAHILVSLQSQRTKASGQRASVVRGCVTNHPKCWKEYPFACMQTQFSSSHPLLPTLSFPAYVHKAISTSLFVVVIQLLSRVQLFVTPCPTARQAPLSMGFPWQEYRSGLPFPSSCVSIPCLTNRLISTIFLDSIYIYTQ